MKYNNFTNLSQEEFQMEVRKLSSEEQRQLLQELEQMSPKKTFFVKYWWIFMCIFIALMGFGNTFDNRILAKICILLCVMGAIISVLVAFAYHGKKHLIMKCEHLKATLGKTQLKHYNGLLSYWQCVA